jgi:hypothetical protein
MLASVMGLIPRAHASKICTLICDPLHCFDHLFTVYRRISSQLSRGNYHNRIPEFTQLIWLFGATLLISLAFEVIDAGFELFIIDFFAWSSKTGWYYGHFLLVFVLRYASCEQT